MQQSDYNQLIVPNESRMINCIWRIVRTSADTDDVMQESLLHIHKHFATIRLHPNPTALLLRICAQKAVDHLRRRNVIATSDNAISAELIDDAPSPRQLLSATERQHELFAFIQELPPREAEVITLHALEEMSYAEIASALGCSPSTARVLACRARERFRIQFRGIGSAPSTKPPPIDPSIDGDDDGA